MRDCSIQMNRNKKRLRNFPELTDELLSAIPSTQDLIHYHFGFATYWDGMSVVKGEDFIPFEKKFKRLGNEMQTAQTAIEIAKASVHIVHIRKILAQAQVKFTAHELYHATQMDKIPKKLQVKLVKQLNRRMNS
jgi:hypothetical protein